MTKWHISSATHTSFWTQQKNKKVNVSDPSEVRGNITIIFKRIKTDPQILFSILMNNLIAIMRIKSLGSLLRWLWPRNTTVKNQQFRFSFYSFKKKIHCCLDRHGYMGFLSWLNVPAVNCHWGKWQPLPCLLPHKHQGVSGRLELLNDMQIIFSTSVSSSSRKPTQLIHTRAYWNQILGRLDRPSKGEQRARHPHPPAATRAQISVHISLHCNINWSVFQTAWNKMCFISVQTDLNILLSIFHPSIVNLSFSASLNSRSSLLIQTKSDSLTPHNLGNTLRKAFNYLNLPVRYRLSTFSVFFPQTFSSGYTLHQ